MGPFFVGRENKMYNPQQLAAIQILGKKQGLDPDWTVEAHWAIPVTTDGLLIGYICDHDLEDVEQAAADSPAAPKLLFGSEIEERTRIGLHKDIVCTMPTNAGFAILNDDTVTKIELASDYVTIERPGSCIAFDTACLDDVIASLQALKAIVDKG